MICAFAAIMEALPPLSQQRVASILNAALADNVIEDVDAREVVRCLAYPHDGPPN
jgi:hypothetical protein